MKVKKGSKQREEVQSLEWHTQSTTDPFWNATSPIEVLLVDESRTVLTDPAAKKDEYRELVIAWRHVPGHVRETMHSRE